MVIHPIDIGEQPARVPPVRAAHAQPPWRAARRAHDVSGARSQSEVEDRAVPENLSLGGITSGLDETSEVTVGHTRRVDVEPGDAHLVHRPLSVGAVAVTERVPHAKRAGRDGPLLDPVLARADRLPRQNGRRSAAATTRCAA